MRVEVARTYRELLRNGPLGRLLIGEFVSAIGDWLYLVALVVLVYQQTQDPVLLGIVGAARMLPYIFLSVPAGMITDRFDRRYVLLVSDLSRAACMLVLAYLVAVDGPLWAIAAVAILAACFSTFFYPAIGALLPSLVRDEREFGPANSAWATLDNLAWIVGPGIAGVILATGQIAMAFVLNAISFGLIAVILWTLPRSAPKPLKAAAVETAATVEPVAAADPAAARESVVAATPVRRSLLGRLPAGIDGGAVTGVILASSVAWFAFGGISILIVVLAVDVFKGGDAATGYLNAAIGIGGTIGAIVSGALVLRPRLGRVLLLGSLALGGAAVLLGVANSLLIAFVAVIVASVGNLLVDVTGTTIFQRAVPDAYRGRLGGVMMTGQTAAEALGTLVLPILVSVFGFGWVFGIAGVLVVGLTALAVSLIGSAADLVAGPYDADLRRIARLSLFGGLSPARVEAALRRLDPVVVTAGEVVIREGDVADRFYVICGGSLRVSKLDHHGVDTYLRTLGQDDVFGERGLIARAPRAATITADTDAFLFAMDGPDFLELIGGQKEVADRMMALYESPGESHSHG